MDKERRTQHVGVLVTASENRLLREVAHREGTTKSTLLRRLFLKRYVKQEEQREQTK